MANVPQVWMREALDAPHDQPDKARRVRQMFEEIAPRYQLVNTVFSGGRDAYWRRKTVELASVRDDDDVLDIACGTGGLARAFAKAAPRSVTGVDFAHRMLLRATRSNARRRRIQNPEGRPTPFRWCEADALHLPFDAASFSIASCAFGVRNFQDLDVGLAEMFRVLRSGGRAVILEFARPPQRIVRRVYEFYASRVMPLGATWLSGDRSGAYRYLPRSVVSFLTTDQMCARLNDAGFAHTTATPLTFGVVTVFVARKN